MHPVDFLLPPPQPAPGRIGRLALPSAFFAPAIPLKLLQIFRLFAALEFFDRFGRCHVGPGICGANFFYHGSLPG
jgi:hypothetical protein